MGDCVVRLVWITESELDNLGFILERAFQREGQFIQIASYESLDALKGAGNSSEQRRYFFTDPSVFNDITYWYRLTDVSIHGVQTHHPPISATPTAPDLDLIEEVAADEEIPRQITLLQNYPNPFNPNTKIRLMISDCDDGFDFLNLSIYDINGKMVKILFDGVFQSPISEFEWDGRNEFGEPMAGGIYVYRLRTNNNTQSRKMLLLK